MTTGTPEQYYFSQEQRTRLGQVYRLIMSWRQERLAAQAKQVDQKASIPDTPMNNRPLLEGKAERSEV
jgi:hypothetical protein